ncbi:hypothetical protein [Serratia proteamaculans]
MILNINKAVNTLLSNFSISTNPLAQGQGLNERLFCEGTTSEQSYANMNLRPQGNYSIDFVLVNGAEKDKNSFMIRFSEIIEYFRVEVPHVFCQDFIIIDWIISNQDTHQDKTTGTCTGVFTLNISVIEK